MIFTIIGQEVRSRVAFVVLPALQTLYFIFRAEN
jgi:hypothetical protein